MSLINIMKNFQVIRTISNFSITSFRYSSKGHFVQMRGLDYDATEEDIIAFFKPLGIVPKKIDLKRDGSGRTAGFSEVEFNTHAEAVIALRKKNAFIGNRFIRLALKSSDINNETSTIENQKTQTTLKDKIDETRILETVYSSGHFIRMRNMPWRITDQDIFDFFWPVGARPVSVKPVYNESGIRTGEFDVQFLSMEDVQKAAAKNNAYLRNKYVELSYDES